MITAKLLLLYILQTSNIVGVNVDISKIDPEQAFCLAENIYYESANEAISGQYAVAHVTINRANDSRFPKTICEVVKQSTVSKIGNKIVCAFSWYCENNKKGKEIPLMNKDGSINQVEVDRFQIASIVAITALSGDIPDNTMGATHFYNPSISQPSWSKSLKKTISLGRHDFYKWQ